MAISKVNPVSTSTEPIVTVKITDRISSSTFPVPFTAGNYRIDTGYSGTLYVRIKNSSGSDLANFSFATTSFFTISGTGTTVEILAPAAAINGVVTFQQLTRGVVNTATGWNTVNLASDQHGAAGIHLIGNVIWVVGGNDTASYNGAGTTSTIEKYDIATGTRTTVKAASSEYAGYISSVAVGTNIFYQRGDGPNAQTGTASSGTQKWYKLDTTTDTVTALTGRPAFSSIQNYVANTAGTKIYSFGSWTKTGGSGANSSYVYDIAANTWTEIAAMPSSVFSSSDNLGRNDFANLNNSDQIIIFKHRTLNGTAANTGIKTWRYNIAANTYTELAGDMRPESYQNMGAVVTKSGDSMYGYYLALNQGPSTGNYPNIQLLDYCKPDGSASGLNPNADWGTLLPNYSTLSDNQGAKMSMNDSYVVVGGTPSYGSISQVYYKSLQDFLSPIKTGLGL